MGPIEEFAVIFLQKKLSKFHPSETIQALFFLITEWETFFKLHTFEKYLVPSIPLIIHFSTSIYSKLIVTCSARPQCLNIASPVKSSLGMAPDATKCVLETVTRFLKKDFGHFGQNTPEIKKINFTKFQFEYFQYNTPNKKRKKLVKLISAHFMSFLANFLAQMGNMIAICLQFLYFC